MGQQIIKQPDGLYCIWSSIVDDIIWYDCTRQDIIDTRMKEAKERIESGVDEVLAKIEARQPPYYQFTKTWDEVKRFVARDRKKKNVTSSSAKPATPGSR